MNNTEYVWRICQNSVRPHYVRTLATIEASEAEASLLARDYAVELRSDVVAVYDDKDNTMHIQATYYGDGTRRRFKQSCIEQYDRALGQWVKAQ